MRDDKSLACAFASGSAGGDILPPNVLCPGSHGRASAVEKKDSEEAVSGIVDGGHFADVHRVSSENGFGDRYDCRISSESGICVACIQLDTVGGRLVRRRGRTHPAGCRKRHQTNLTIQVRISDMTVAYCNYLVGHNRFGYVALQKQLYLRWEGKKAFCNRDMRGKKLTAGKDYSVVYKNNIKAGTASVTITGTGSYKGKGSVPQNFTIKRLPRP